MTPGMLTLLVAIVFASQILVCSFLSAWRFARAARLLRQQYPAEKYPRLYPLPPEQMQRHAALRNAVRIAIGIAAVVLLVSALVRRASPGSLAQLMLGIILVQLIPMALALPQQIRLAKAMRSMPAPAIRSADLRSWSATEFVSPAEVLLGIAMSCAALACTLYLYVRHSALTPALTLSLVANGFLLVRMLLVLYGPTVMHRPDPYMSEDDLYRARRFRMRLLFRMAIAAGLYFSFVLAWREGWLRIDGVYVAIGLSIATQLTSQYLTRRAIRAVTERDPAPYRTDMAG